MVILTEEYISGALEVDNREDKMYLLLQVGAQQLLLFVELHVVLQNDPKKLCGRIPYPVFHSFRTCELNLPPLLFTGATSMMESLDKWN